MENLFRKRYFIICVIFNLVAGNVILFMSRPEISFTMRAVLSSLIVLVLITTFRRYSFGKNSKTVKKILAGFGCALVSQWIACTFMGMVNPISSVFEGALKGAIPLFAFSVIFMPLWLLFGALNSVCLYFADLKPKNNEKYA